MKRLAIVRAPILAGIALVFAGPLASAQGTLGDRNVVTITLLPEIAIDDTVIYLDQIAKLSGGPIALRQRLARLDVAEFKLTAEQTAVPSDQVKFRLMLAGIGQAQFQFSGAKRTIVTGNDEPITARKILAVAEQAIRAKNPRVGAHKDIVAPLLDVRPSDKVQFDAKPPRPGVLRVDVIILVNNKMREIVPVPFEPEHKSESPQRGSYTQSRAGARRDLLKEKDEPLIKSRDFVRIVATIGSTQIVANGEAQQDGRVGEIIRVRNVESNRIVNARVESRDVVLVDQ